MRIQYRFDDHKDFFEKSGDLCLYFGRKAFGYYKVGPMGTSGNPTIEKVVASTKIIFLFLLTFPVSALVSMTGIGLTALSQTHTIKYAKMQMESKPGSPPTLNLPPPDQRQHQTLERWQRQYDKLVERFEGDDHALRSALRQHRISLYRETKRICSQGHYYVNDVRVSFDEQAKQRMIDGTESFPLQPPLPPLNDEDRHDTEIVVIEEDTFQLGEWLKSHGCRPVALNMANAFTPGGGVEGGCGAQEESLFRRSNYFQALYPVRNTLYPIPGTHVIYTPEVQIFRNPETYLEHIPEARHPGYGFRTLRKMDMIACAFPDLRRNEAAPNYEADIRDRIRNILRVSFIKGHDALALGAIGCGAFANDPRIVARVFKEELLSDEFRGRFKKIGFGIIYPEIIYNQEQLDLIYIFRAEFNGIV